MSAGREDLPHITIQWSPRAGRFMYWPQPIVLRGFQMSLAREQQELNRKAYQWCREQNLKVRA